jgi:hypothetical protein
MSVELPEQLKYVEASGETKVTADGQKLQFGKVDQIRAGEKARWKVTTKATRAGEIRFRVDMTSRHLSRKTTAEEPTVLFDSGQNVSQAKKAKQSQ